MAKLRGGERQPSLLERTPAKPTVPPTSRESAVAASRVIALAGEVTRAEYIQALIAMEERYPGYGWIEEANRLEDWYIKHGLALSEKPAKGDVGWTPKWT